ncbi:MAG: hypothetical protein CL610_20360 [Anaerolineaceae bacterium]|nr:hypothetical protein [Anaerolineaceae bacterium]
MHVYFSTVFRYAPPDQSGEFICLNWDTKTVEQRVPVLLDNFPVDDPNPRGNSRGGRGIALINNQIFASTYHSLKVFDRDLNFVRNISHPLMSGLHEVHAHDDKHIWVTSTSIDAVLLINVETGEAVRTYWPREMPELQKHWGLEPLAIDKEADNRNLFLAEHHGKHPSHLHLNAVTTWRGEVYAFFRRFGAIVNLDTGEVLIEEPQLRGGHNLIIRDDGLTFINDTKGHGVYVYDLPRRKLVRRINLLPFHPIGLYTRFYDFSMPARHFLRKHNLYNPLVANPFFVRGMDLVNNCLFIGLSPASILHLDWEQGKLIDRFIYTDNSQLTVHGIKVVED